MNADRDGVGPEALPEEACAGLERLEFGIVRAAAFGKDNDVVAMIDGFAGMLKTAPESTELRQWENIEQASDQPISEWCEEVEIPVTLIAAFAVIEEHLSSHGNGNTASNDSWEGVEDERRVVGGEVVRDNECGSFGPVTDTADDTRFSKEASDGIAISSMNAARTICIRGFQGQCQ